MDEQELEATLMKSGFRADSTMLGATQLSRKRHTALLSGLEKSGQSASADVANLIEHRERRTAITTMALGAYELLRLAEPEIISSVLSLAPPKLLC